MRDFLKHLLIFAPIAFVFSKLSGYGIAIFLFKLRKTYPQYSKMNQLSVFSLKYQHGSEKFIQLSFFNFITRFYFNRNMLHHEHLGI